MHAMEEAEHLLTKLDNLMAENTPLSEEPRSVHGSDYTTQYDVELKRSPKS